jgi:hypothetical protein
MKNMEANNESARCRKRRRCALSITALLLAGAIAARANPHDGGVTRIAQSALLPVPNTENDGNDSADFRPAEPDTVLHEFILLPGWVKEPEFDELRRWMLEQGFDIKRALEPRPWQTYPSIKFSGTVAQIEQAFHVMVMRGPGSFHRCYTVFDSLRMPACFAPKGESYIEGFSFSEEAALALRRTAAPNRTMSSAAEHPQMHLVTSDSAHRPANGCSFQCARHPHGEGFPAPTQSIGCSDEFGRKAC